ncbi:hypothetical protein L5515_015788 [Caenorhabditis briggsae]|uniref:Uncharacterized protein n=1 Tax=Caenorhabditis briggsae TaxID=6238 RepID=A0AAE9IWF7_CAEBR|nr:hypothetical protein L3Y34_019691 [Caenorhabditis briggsae]UMM20565.1 hypothetical protein L5515_015788 [Caenorhabditis briggsae]
MDQFVGRTRVRPSIPRHLLRAGSRSHRGSSSSQPEGATSFRSEKGPPLPRPHPCSSR